MSEKSNDNAAIYRDERFAHLFKDPRFKNIQRTEQKIKIDKRFKSMFEDDKFNIKYSVDKYGRWINKTTSEDLKKYYHISSSDDDNDDVDNDDDDKDVEDEVKVEIEEEKKEVEDINNIKSIKKTQKNELKKSKKIKNQRINNLEEDEEDKIPEASDDEISVPIKRKLADLSIDYARGKGVLYSDSSSDDDSSDDDDKELFIEHVWGEMDLEAPRTDDVTHRLAACNMDWDRIRAVDIMVLCNSFLPPRGLIVSVSIYPSEYGKERMAEEEVKGPQELREQSNDHESSDEYSDLESNNQNDDGSDYHMEKLRQYQLNRLKYYYAVIECDSLSTADKLYQECDGLEYESTATKLDLRFIPNDMTFDDEPKDVCTELPDLGKYKPRLFTTTALQQAKVELTWDENDVDRKELNEKLVSGKINEVADHDLRKYVAYSSEEDENSDEDNETLKGTEENSTENNSIDDFNVLQKSQNNRKENSISKYKALLQEIQQKEKEDKNKQFEMEYTWKIGTISGDTKSDEITTNSNTELTHFEKILQKKKEKKIARKEERKKLRQLHKNGKVNDEDGKLDDSDSDDLPDGIDLNDPYFAEEFANGDFQPAKKSTNIDKRKGKLTRMEKNEEEEEEEDGKSAELKLLLDDDVNDSNKMHFSLKKIQDLENNSKSKKRKQKLKQSKKQSEAEKSLLHDDFELNVNDDRFKSVYSSHLFNIDPTNSNYKKTKGMDRLIQEKLKRRPADNDVIDENVSKKPKRDVAVSMLVKSIKRKIGQPMN